MWITSAAALALALHSRHALVAEVGTDGRRLIESLVPEIAPNASVVGVEERERYYSVTIAGTTGVLAGVDVPRDAVEAAEHSGEARERLVAALKRCADDVVAEIPDGRA